jgi:MFS family permease
MGMVAAPRLELFTQVICQQINQDAIAAHLPMLFLDPQQCRHSTTVQKRVAQLNLFLQLIMGVLCIITTTFWGSMSDKYGRKKVLILNMLSFVLGDIVLVTVFTFPDRVSYFWLLLMPAFEGLFGGYGGVHLFVSTHCDSTNIYHSFRRSEYYVCLCKFGRNSLRELAEMPVYSRSVTVLRQALVPVLSLS